VISISKITGDINNGFFFTDMINLLKKCCFSTYIWMIYVQSVVAILFI